MRLGIKFDCDVPKSASGKALFGLREIPFRFRRMGVGAVEIAVDPGTDPERFHLAPSQLEESPQLIDPRPFRGKLSLHGLGSDGQPLLFQLMARSQLLGSHL